MPNDGVHGLIQDSGQVRIADFGTLALGTSPSITRGMVRLLDDRPQTEARDWTIYESCDWLQQGPDGDWTGSQIVELLIEESTMQIGRGRVSADMYVPPWIPKTRRSGVVLGAAPWCRARARSFRATSADFAVRAAARMTFAGPRVVVRDNYRAWLCEGRPISQWVGETCTTLAEATVVTAGVYTVPIATISQTLEIPDYAQELRICSPRGLAMVVGFLDQFGSALVDFPNATNVTGVGQLPVPGAATRAIVTTAAGNQIVPVAWNCIL